jgi:hypothetical protein
LSLENDGLRYHHSQHLEAYDHKYISLPGAELELLVEELDELLYPDPRDQFEISVHSARAGQGSLSTHFNHTYLRSDRREWVWPLESLSFSVDHSIYFGNIPVKQCYKIQLDSSIQQSVVKQDQIVALDNRVTTLYYLEETPVEDERFKGSMIRPNITNEENPTSELMTAYDCERLYDEISALRTLAIYVSRERQALERVGTV